VQDEENKRGASEEKEMVEKERKERKENKRVRVWST
jgi:hypothetical protein